MNFLAKFKFPEFCRNFHRTLIAIVRSVRSLADRTFQLRPTLRRRPSRRRRRPSRGPLRRLRRRVLKLQRPSMWKSLQRQRWLSYRFSQHGYGFNWRECQLELVLLCLAMYFCSKISRNHFAGKMDGGCLCAGPLGPWGLLATGAVI